MKSFGAVAALILVLSACSSDSAKSTIPDSTSKPVKVTVPEPVLKIAVAGDVACSDSQEEAAVPGTCHDKQVEKLIAGEDPDAILMPGDIQYEEGAFNSFEAGFAQLYGKYKDKLYPVPGNHDYGKGNANGYFQYFGPRVGTPDHPYYSAEIGKWKLLAIDSNCSYTGCDENSKQVKWLDKELEAPQKCTIAMWHHPRFSSGKHGNNEFMNTIWQKLADAKVDVVVNGHDHTFEVFKPMNSEGKSTPAGTREFVVGTGGRSLYYFTHREPNSDSQIASVFGALFLDLGNGAYGWQFKSAGDAKVLNSGNGKCD